MDRRHRYRYGLATRRRRRHIPTNHPHAIIARRSRRCRHCGRRRRLGRRRRHRHMRHMVVKMTLPIRIRRSRQQFFHAGRRVRSLNDHSFSGNAHILVVTREEAESIQKIMIIRRLNRTPSIKERGQIHRGHSRRRLLRRLRRRFARRAKRRRRVLAPTLP